MRRASSRSPGWLMPALWLAALVIPTASMLWLMNGAVSSQTTAARQSVLEAYRTQLRFISDQINTYWETRATELDRAIVHGTAAEFDHAVRSGLVDSMLVVDGTGAVPYRVTAPAATNDARHTGSPLAARARAFAARDAVRALLQRGDHAGALREIERTFLGPDAPRGTDLEGRSIDAGEHLLALTLMSPGDATRARTIQQLAHLLGDYDGLAMPPSQRLFLMSELRVIQPDLVLPTHDAEGIATDVLDTGIPRTDVMGLQPTRVPDIWSLASGSGRIVGLYRQTTVHAAQHDLVDEYESDMVRFDIFPPGEQPYPEAIAVGTALPGWQAAFRLLDAAALDRSAHARVASYLWVGILGIGLFALVAVGVGHTVRQQLRLTRLKTDLVAAVSHEIRTPLASMRLLVDALLRDEVLDPVKTREYLDLMAVENGRLSRLIDNFLTFSRLERQRHRFAFTPTPPAGIVGAAVDAMRERLHPGCAIDMEIAPDLPHVAADADALVTALLNLLDNAYKYTPNDKRIAVRAYAEHGHVVFAVADNGIGIPAGEQKRIFRRFYRVDRRLSRETAGVGLGLSIVHEIVRAHRGTVHVRSTAGEGSTFTVRVPAAAGAPA